MKDSWNMFKERKGALAPAGAVIALLSIIPIAILTVIFFQFSISSGQSATIDYFLNIIIRVASYTLVTPFLLLAFSHISTEADYDLSVKQVFGGFKAYPSYFLLCLVSSLFYALIYIVCYGLPLFASDPILRLVWVVLVNYWAAIVLPVPVMMNKLEIGALKAIKLSYKHFHDLRWNIYLMALVLLLLNALAFSFLLVGLLITIPFTWFCIRDYTQKLLDFELLDYRR